VKAAEERLREQTEKAQKQKTMLMQRDNRI